MTWADENGCNFLNWKSNTHTPLSEPPPQQFPAAISYLPFHTDLMYKSAHISFSSSPSETQTEADDTHCSAPCFFTDYILETAPCWHNWTHVILFNAMAYARGWQTTAHGPNLACCCQFLKYTIIFMDHSHAHSFPIAYSTCELQKQAVAGTTRSEKPKIFTILPFKENVCGHCMGVPKCL